MAKSLYTARAKPSGRRRTLGRNLLRLVIPVAVAAALAGFSLSAHQDPKPEPEKSDTTLKSEAGYTVRVDAVVTDKHNRVLTDLTRDDFVLFENDVEQTIDTFEIVRPETAGENPAAEPQPSADIAPAANPGPVRPNLIVFLLDYATTQFENQKLVEDACRKYVEENVRRGDLVAVFSLSTSFRFLQDFTGDKQLLLAALTRGEAGGNSLRSASSSPTPPGAAARVGTVETGGGAPANTAAAAQAAAAGGSAQADLMLAERIQNLYYVMNSFLGRREAYSVLAAIQAIAEGVREVEGRKTMLLFSQGFVIGPHMERELEKTVSVANKANLSIYGVDSQGLSTRELSGALVPRNELSSISANQGNRRIQATGGESLFDRAKQVGSDVRDTSLRYISGATGGFAIRNSNDLYLSLQRIDQDVRTYYLLSYRPHQINFDGEFRKVRVEVKRKDAEVRARSGYLALPPGMELVSGEEFQLLREIQAGRTPLELPTFFRADKLHGPGGSPRLLLTLEIPSPAVKFNKLSEETGDVFVADLTIIGLVRDETGRIVTRFGAPLNLRVPAGEFANFANVNLSFGNIIELPPGAYSFDVVARDLNSEKAGRAEASLRLPPASAGLDLSSIVLGTDLRANSGTEGVLTYKGTRVVPSAGRTFNQNDKLVFYLDIAGFALDPASGQPDLSVEVSVARFGSSQKIALPPIHVGETEGSGESAAVSRYIDLATLPEGSYFLSARVTDTVSGKNAAARTTFQIRN